MEKTVVVRERYRDTKIAWDSCCFMGRWNARFALFVCIIIYVPSCLYDDCWLEDWIGGSANKKCSIYVACEIGENAGEKRKTGWKTQRTK